MGSNERTAWTTLDVKKGPETIMVSDEDRKKTATIPLSLFLSGGEANQKRPFITNPVLKRIIPLMKGKKQKREPEYIHCSKCGCVWLCMGLRKAQASCECVCVFTCVYAGESHECAMRGRLKEARR